MKFTVCSTSRDGYKGPPEIEIETLEALIAFATEHGEIILRAPESAREVPDMRQPRITNLVINGVPIPDQPQPMRTIPAVPASIEIYDDCRE